MKAVPVVRTGLRYVLGGIFIYAGVLHFTKTLVYESVMPPYLLYHRALVLISGVCEVAGGLGVLLPFPLRRWAGWGLVALLIAVFPANVQMALHGANLGSGPLSPLLLWARLPLQAVLIAWVWWCAVASVTAPRTIVHGSAPSDNKPYPWKFFDFSEERKQIIASNPDIGAAALSNRALDQGFPKAVQKMGWTLLKAGGKVDLAALPYAIIVGIFIWDNRALRELETLHARLSDRNIPVFVVDIDGSPSLDDVQKLMPQMEWGFVNSPVLMEYRNGVATQTNWPETDKRISEL